MEQHHGLAFTGLCDVEIEASRGLEPMAHAINLWHVVGHGAAADVSEGPGVHHDPDA